MCMNAYNVRAVIWVESQNRTPTYALLRFSTMMNDKAFYTAELALELLPFNKRLVYWLQFRIGVSNNFNLKGLVMSYCLGRES